MWPSQRLASIGLESWQGKAQARRRDRRGIRPIVSLLEERTLLSTLNLTVNTLIDDPSGPTSGSTTLRDAITQANADTTDSQEVISFAPSLQGTIDLTSALPALKNNTTIQGPGFSVLTVQRLSSAPDFSVFTVDSGVTVSLLGMTISGGDAGTDINQGGGLDNFGTSTVDNSVLSNDSAYDGGGIYNESGGTLTVINSTFASNSAIQGGGLFNAGTLIVNTSTFSGNSAVYGGGIFNGDTLTVSDSTFTGNSAGWDGGGIYAADTTTVSDSTFTGNSADASGGGIDNQYAGILTVTNSTFTNNSALQQGGGIVNFGVTLLVTDSTFTGNTASNGGGIFNYVDCTVTVTESTFIDNSTTDYNGVIPYDIGGGIFNTGAATVSNSSFTENSSGSGGGIYNNSNSTLTVTNSTFNNNSATDGGGFYNFGTVTVTDNTFTSNSAADGGGIYNSTYDDSTLTVNNSTFTGNSATSGGGIYNVGNLTLNNTIVAGNTGTGTSDDDVSGTVSSTSAFNLIGDGTGITNLNQLAQSNLIGTTADPINPLLGPLAYNGGPTQTMALLPGSPAINAGSNALAVDAQLTTDQRGAGFSRVVNGTVDIGAFEFGTITTTALTSSASPSTYGQSMTFTATVSDTASGVPTGSIEFYTSRGAE